MTREEDETQPRLRPPTGPKGTRIRRRNLSPVSAMRTAYARVDAYQRLEKSLTLAGHARETELRSHC